MAKQYKLNSKVGIVVLLVALALVVVVILIPEAPTFERGSDISPRCREAFAQAAAVDAYRDTHADLFPAFRACTTLTEWQRADRLYPDAMDGVNPIVYARNVCASYDSVIGDSRICQLVK